MLSLNLLRTFFSPCMFNSLSMTLFWYLRKLPGLDIIQMGPSSQFYLRNRYIFILKQKVYFPNFNVCWHGIPLPKMGGSAFILNEPSLFTVISVCVCVCVCERERERERERELYNCNYQPNQCPDTHRRT